MAATACISAAACARVSDLSDQHCCRCPLAACLLTLPVSPACAPAGCQVWSILEAQAELLGELDEEGATLTVAAGGRGGRGNALATSKPHGPASRHRTDGQPGQEVRQVLAYTGVAALIM